MKVGFLLILFFGLICFAGHSQERTAYMVADAHLDTQWDWDVQTTIKQYIKNTLNDNFALFKKYPNYKFNFEGAIKYMWFKEYYPELYSQLKTYVASGQWNVAGSSLDANDVNVPSPESIFRNILIGQTFYKNEFGKKSNDIFLPDCFGFGYALPSIMNHAGLIGFCTQKLSWGGVITPFKIGAWQGVDGSKVLAAASAGGYGDTFSEDLSYRTELINWANETGGKTASKYYIAYRLYGTGDRGGAPQDSTVYWIERSMTSNGPVKIKSATSGEMYTKYYPNINDFPQYNGELIMTQHGTGCYTSRTMMKRWNRKNELLADAAEKSAVMADWLGGLTYPAADLNEAWIKFLWHQFHDDLTGTSIPKAYTFSYNDEVIAQNKFASVLQNAVGAGVRSLNTQTEGTPIVVYNPLSIDREDVVEVNLKVSAKTDYLKVVNKSGVEVASQVILSNDTLVKFIFKASVKQMGYEVYDVRPSATAPAVDANILKITNNSLENSAYKVTIDSNGDISSVVDKLNGDRQLLSGPIRLALLNNYSDFWPSWEVTYSAITSTPRAYVDGTPEISIEEQGPVRVTLKITRRKEKSTFVQYIRLTNSDTKKRIDVENEVDWKTQKTLLKAVFPLSVNNPDATYDLGLGVIKRPNNLSKRYEVPAQQWADITNTDNSYGVSILNDCKYGWDKPSNNTLRLSLIHTPEITTRYTYQGNQDLGPNKFTYSIYGHTQNSLDAASTWEASKLNQPLMAFETVKHGGDLGKSFSFVNIESSQIALKALKKAESGNNYVLRFYETKGTSANNIKIKFASKILAAKELNAIEEEIGNATFSDSTLTISMTAFQPKTFGVQLASPTVALTTPESKTLTLPYNSDAISTQANMANGNFDGNSNSYAAEILSDEIVTDGIKFAIGPKSDGSNNVLKCGGNKIAIPAGYKKLYILAASSNANGSTATFNIGQKASTLYIPYFSNFVGQAVAYNFTAGDTVLSNSYFKKENIAWTGTHLHNGSSKVDQAYVFSYLFKYCIDIPAGATELTLPDNTGISIFAMTAANNQNDDTKPAAELMEVQKLENTSGVQTFCGENISQLKSATASGQTGTAENAAKGLDGNESTKWCHVVAADKWLAIDLGKPTKICEWRVKHAGLENLGYITKDFKLQKLVGTDWLDVDVVTGNALNTTDRLVAPFLAQQVRLYITNSGNDNAARIYEFQVFGELLTDVKEIKVIKPSVKIFPNPVVSEDFNIQLLGFEDENEVCVTITDIFGREIYRSNMRRMFNLNVYLKNKMSIGIYFLNVSGRRSAANCKFIVG